MNYELGGRINSAWKSLGRSSLLHPGKAICDGFLSLVDERKFDHRDAASLSCLLARQTSFSYHLLTVILGQR
jgi:hypothetical protein